MQLVSTKTTTKHKQAWTMYMVIEMEFKLTESQWAEVTFSYHTTDAVCGFFWGHALWQVF